MLGVGMDAVDRKLRLLADIIAAPIVRRSAPKVLDSAKMLSTLDILSTSI